MECLYSVSHSVAKTDETSIPHQDCVSPPSTIKCNSSVVQDDNKSNPSSKCETNYINDNRVKSRNKTILSDAKNSAPRVRDKTVLDDCNRRNQASSINVDDNDSCDNIADPKKERGTAKIKTKTLDSIDTDQVNPSTRNRETNSRSSDNTNLPRTRRQQHKADTSCDHVSARIEKDTNVLNKEPLHDNKFTKPGDHLMDTTEIDQNTKKEATLPCLCEASIESRGYPTVLEGLKTPTKQDSFESLEDQLEPVTTSLSPIPDTPERPSRSVELPCFGLLDHLPLSPIPPSPPPSPSPTGGCISSDVNFNVDPSPKEARVSKKQKRNSNNITIDVIYRYPGVKEIQFVPLILSKLKNKEITLEDLIKAFSLKKNVKNHTTIARGIVVVLNATQDDEEHALMTRCAEHDDRGFEDTGVPVVSEFEMQVLIAVKRLGSLQRHCQLLNKLVRLSGIKIFQLFNSGKNDAAVLAMCRMYTGACRLMSEGSCVRVLCYDILKQNKRYSFTEKMINSIAMVWPEVVRRGSPCLTIQTEAVTICGPPYHSFLATLQLILMSREMSCDRTRKCLRRLCGWGEISRDTGVLEWFARDLLRVLRDTSEGSSQKSPEYNSAINNVAFETIKSLELVAVIMGWKWTNDVLIREILWPVFKEWKMNGFDAKQELQNSKAVSVDDPNCSTPDAFYVDFQSTSNETFHSVMTELSSAVAGVKTESECKHDGNKQKPKMNIMIQNILGLLGVLGSERLRNGEMTDLNAVINLMCAIVSGPDCEKVSFSVQLAAASALLDMINADPMEITRVLVDWTNRCSAKGDTLTVQFESRMRDVRTRMSTA